MQTATLVFNPPKSKRIPRLKSKRPRPAYRGCRPEQAVYDGPAITEGRVVWRRICRYAPLDENSRRAMPVKKGQVLFEDKKNPGVSVYRAGFRQNRRDSPRRKARASVGRDCR